ncbi:hypothetical protein [Bacillus atrophaeus]
MSRKKNSLTDEDYNKASSAAYNLRNYHIGTNIEVSNGQKLYVVDYKKN